MLEMAERLIEYALGDPKTLSVGLPRAGRVTLRSQQSMGRDVLHLLHATPSLRGQLGGSNIQPIQDLVTLKDIAVSIRIGNRAVSGVYVVPDGQALDFQSGSGVISFTVPEVRGHQMVEIAYQ